MSGGPVVAALGATPCCAVASRWMQRRSDATCPDREVATLLPQVVVDAGDAAFAHPTKPIRPID
jgi:carbamate kinase